MSLASRLIGALAKLPPAETYDVKLGKDIPVTMPDGVVLLADHYYARNGGKRPTILVRSPYGRAGMFGLLFGRLFAERGFQVLIQSCRGTFGSGGKFDAFRNERADGLATLAWLKQQPWFSGEIATIGPSYLGFVQWAVAADAGPMLKAMATQITASEFRSLVYPGESFGLDTSLNWIYLLSHQEDSSLAAFVAQARASSALDASAAFRHLPLRETDELATGKPVSFFRDWLEHDEPGDEWWQPVNFSKKISAVAAPVHLLGGWHDIFLPHTLADYLRLRQVGRQPYLTIGPWAHTSPAMFPFMLRESLAWFRANLLGDRSGLRDSPVRVFVMGANQWRDFPEWPPTYMAQRWHLQQGGGLSPSTPAQSEPDRYRYDPADPTPAVGGTSLSQNSGPKDNRKLEARPDVLAYTSAPLDRDVEIVGPVRVELYARSSLAHTDFFARLCDVDSSGKSINVCDGLLRLDPSRPVPEVEGCLKVEIDLWPTAHRFLKGRRIRLQVSSGAHPRYVRNPGSGEPLATATTLKIAAQIVYHDPTRPSAIILPCANMSPSDLRDAMVSRENALRDHGVEIAE